MISVIWFLIVSVLIPIGNTQIWISSNGDILESNETTFFMSSTITPPPSQSLSTVSTSNLSVDENIELTKGTGLWTNLGIAVALSCAVTIMCLAYVKVHLFCDFHHL